MGCGRDSGKTSLAGGECAHCNAVLDQHLWALIPANMRIAPLGGIAEVVCQPGSQRIGLGKSMRNMHPSTRRPTQEEVTAAFEIAPKVSPGAPHLFGPCPKVNCQSRLAK